jgi:hypothetical protein
VGKYAASLGGHPFAPSVVRSSNIVYSGSFTGISLTTAINFLVASGESQDFEPKGVCF